MTAPFCASHSFAMPALELTLGLSLAPCALPHRQVKAPRWSSGERETRVRGGFPFRGLVKLGSFVDSYLFIVRPTRIGPFCRPLSTAIPHALALRLASLPGLAATLGTPQAGSAPYTAFVILSSAELIPPLIAAWAERKAQLDKARARRTLRWSSSGPPSPSRSPSGEERKEKGREARAAQQEQSGSEGQTQAQGSQRRHRRKRTLSWGGWTAPHVVGMGLDMVKGLRIGEGSRPGMGSVSGGACHEWLL